MNSPDSISNRNIKIIATYVRFNTGNYHSLLKGLPYPRDDYSSPEDFFLNEDEWTSFENFEHIFRRARKLVDEPNFYFNCGASSARLKSWGRFHYFVRVFANPNEGFKRLPFFNRNFNDRKDIEILLPPYYDSGIKKFRTLLKIQYHTDFDPNRDFIGDAYLRGIISSIPTIWGLRPAFIKQRLNPYHPEILFSKEPELVTYKLNPKIQGNTLTVRDPQSGRRRTVGEHIVLEPEDVNGQKVFLGKYKNLNPKELPNTKDSLAMRITETIKVNDRILLKAGEIFMAPYFILDISYDRSSIWNRLQQIFNTRNAHGASGEELIETINLLRKNIKAKNKAYLELEKTNEALKTAKAGLDDYARRLEQKVEDRTAELRNAQEDLLQLNRNLEARVKSQVTQLERYNELRRYFSPQLTDKILTSSHPFGAEPQRKMMTVVFADIREFSDLTDTLEPEEIFHILDRYLTEMIQVIHHHDGTLNKIMGDGLLIFFGDPIPIEDHAERAVRMAIDMQNKVAELRDEWLRYGHELGIGIGINTGFMTVGNIGSDSHKDYTVIGNQVNVAARLESEANPGQILITQRTYSAIQGRINAEQVGAIKAKGLHRPIRTYTVIY